MQRKEVVSFEILPFSGFPPGEASVAEQARRRVRKGAELFHSYVGP